ncbi:YheC/YheD family protein [Gorillibacterium massiliense]|uniref:YheC/YheD family endospore coat-associated protein n=1 Tax=Gorillibacterium massiliense TaxID=1280390 RepID=UPI0004AFE4AE|nr:YheC/YheD family protein [Gorillibacterium massiliense]
MINKQTHQLGIMVCHREGDPPFRDRAALADMCRVGDANGVEVVVFSPLSYDSILRMITGYRYRSEEGQWQKKVMTVPALVYDRLFGAYGEEEKRYRLAADRLMAECRLQALSHRIGGKLAVQVLLSRHTALQPHLPIAEPLGSGLGALRRLKEQGKAFLKPDNGCQGKGAVKLLWERVSAAAGLGATMLTASGRDADNQPFTCRFRDENELLIWLKDFTRRRRYLAQDFLDLQDDDGAVCDIRTLVQKDGKGCWKISGMAVRRGLPGSATSNLHGGGAAEELDPYLLRKLGAEQSAAAKNQLRRLSLGIAHVLERHYGNLAELGLDFGIDRGGHLWFIEANSKPGRASFCKNDPSVDNLQYAAPPILYAKGLLAARPIFPLPDKGFTPAAIRKDADPDTIPSRNRFARQNV